MNIRETCPALLALVCAALVSACDPRTTVSSTVSDQELNSLRIELRDVGVVMTNDELRELTHWQRTELHFALASSDFQDRQRVQFILSR